MLQAVPSPGAPPANLAAVCPFGEDTANEDQIGDQLFAGIGKRHAGIGYHLSTSAGYVVEGSYRDSGSSGGFGTWLQCEFLKRGLVDHVINIQPCEPTNDDPRMFRYAVASTEAEIARGAKSRYYPVELSEVLRTVRAQPGRYLLVGLPCFVKAARLLCRQDEILSGRLRFFIGLVCGHLKSTRFAEFLGWQMGVPPGELTGFDFRKKLSGWPASQYGLEAWRRGVPGSTASTTPARDLLGQDWGHGFFKYKACDFCDDVVAETADVSVGDAWLPPYVNDSRGTNVLVVRSRQVQELLDSAATAGRIHLEAISPEDVARSQDASMRHRRDGLRYRLFLAQRRGEWHPPKRVAPGKYHLPSWDRAKFRLREQLRDLSHAAYAGARLTGRLDSFSQTMNAAVDDYRARIRPRLWGRLMRRSRLAGRALLSLLRP